MMSANIGELTKNVHFRYIAAIFAAIVLTLLSVVIGNNARLFEYVNAGVAVTSLILSVFAIWMTAKSNSKNDENMGKLKDTIDKNTTSANSIREASDTVGDNVAKMTLFIDQIESKIDNSNKVLVQLADKFNDDFKSPNSESISNGEEGNPELPNLPSEDQIKFFISTCSIIGLLTCYIIINLSRRGSYFSSEALQKIDDHFSKLYIDGFLVALKSLRIFGIVDDGEEIGEKFSNINQIQEKNLLNKIDEIVAYREAKDPEKTQTLRQYVLERRASADTFISETT